MFNDTEFKTSGFNQTTQLADNFGRLEISAGAARRAKRRAAATASRNFQTAQNCLLAKKSFYGRAKISVSLNMLGYYCF